VTQIAAPVKTVTIDQTAAAYGLSRRTVQRRIRDLEDRALILALDDGGGRGNVKQYDAADVRRHFRQRPESAPATDAMPEPLSYAEWVGQCFKYNLWKAAQTGDEALAKSVRRQATPPTQSTRPRIR
jgi:DNA-binding transcriptional MocR family regulator